jgi:LacI family gluconate utilization system Gnt-I transcriptional repressor
LSSPPRAGRLKPGKKLGKKLGKKRGQALAPKTPAGTRALRPSSGRPTLKDVANLAGVSTMTVSRVINQPDTVSPDVQAAVKEAIARIGYVPNLLAGGLASSRTGLIAAILPALAHMMFASIAQVVNDRCAARGYQVLLGISGYPETVREEELVRSILSRCPEALYLTGTLHSPLTRRLLKAAKIPIVETWDLSRRPIDMAVGFSHRAVGEAVAGHLLGRGHRRFAVITAGDERAILRRDGFVEAVMAAGAAPPECIITPSATNLPMGRETLGRLVDAGFRGAVFCSSDALALGVMTEAQARGLRIPGDIAVMGFGDFDYAAHTSPSLSSVRVDRNKVGHLVADALLGRLEGKEVTPKVIDVGFDVVGRGST